jgi:hypothetical protein
MGYYNERAEGRWDRTIDRVLLGAGAVLWLAMVLF